ncbi:MAG: class B sortase [Lachnospiraceae bacterium]|jgi:sortase B
MTDNKEKEKRKKKKKGSWISKVLLVAAIGVFLFSVGKLVSIFLEYKAGTDEYEEIRQYAVQSGTATVEDGEAGLQPPEIDFAALQEKNPDVIGWLKVEGLERIDYPIMQGEDNAYYLKHTFEKKQNSAGSVFMDMSNSPDFNDCNTIIYGHNMKNDSMFGSLSDITKENTGYAVSPYFWICTPEGSYLYEIFSVHKTKAVGDTYTLFSAPGEEFDSYVQNMKKLSEIEIATEVSQEDKVVTLSTCTGNSSVRFVVQGKRLPGVY